MTRTDSSTVVGYFPDTDTARRAARTLVDNGFNRDQVELTSEEHLSHLHGSSEYSREGDYSREGGVSGFFKRLFGTEEDTGRYDEAIRHGGAVVTVVASSTDQDRAAEILNDLGAVDVDQHAATGTNEPPAGQSIPVVQEELRVGKRQIQRGGVRVHSRMTEQPVEQDVHLREEHIHVDRRAVDRDATPADLNRRDEVIEVTAMAEEALVDKRTRVVEEVVVGKETTERTQTVRDKVRRTNVEVENIGTGANDYRDHFQTHYGHDRNARYERYEPAYRYGSTLVSRDEYRNRNWDEIEPLLRRDYERTYPESRWEQMKDAVRHGWERVAGHR